MHALCRRFIRFLYRPGAARPRPARSGAARIGAAEGRRTASRSSSAFFAGNGAQVVDAARAIAGVYRGDGRLFAMGNGGSSCDAAHIAVEFLHPITAGRPALAAINLAGDMAMMTAVGNDVGFEHVFVRQVLALARPGDGLIGISTSGNSENLLAAFAARQEHGTRHDRPGRPRRRRDGSAVPTSTIAWWCATDSIHRIQETHVAIYHILWDLVHTLLADDRGGAATGSSADEVRRRIPRPGQGAHAAGARFSGWSSASMSAEPRPLQIMEVCGGHTHTIFRYGIEDLLPASDRVRARPRLPGLRAADGPGRRLRRAGRAARGHLHDLRRRDARAGLEEEPAAGQGRGRRRAHGLFAARRACSWRARTRTARGRLLRPRLRDDDAEHRDDGAAGASATACATSRCSATTSRSSRPSRRSSIRPTCSSTASSGPGHVSMVIGTAALRVHRASTTAGRWWSPASSRSTSCSRCGWC